MTLNGPSYNRTNDVSIFVQTALVTV